MKEYKVAKEKVLPYIRDNMDWPEYLISAYGRVPVQVGSSIVWADFVCYINKDQKPVPWLLVEVKKAGITLEQAIPQAESYSLILDAPFFCVTDGDKFNFYSTGISQGKSIALQGLSPVPSLEYLEKGVKHISFPPQIDNVVELFLFGLKEEEKFLSDTRLHDEAAKQMHKNIFQRIDSLSEEELKNALNKFVMMKLPNRNLIYKQIEEDFGKFKKVLKFIRDFDGDPVININRLIDIKDNLHIRGGGIFFITQLLAGAHPNDYIVLEENVSRALRYLGITDILVKNDTANGYAYINEICRKLYKEKLEKRLKQYDFGLTAVHNLLWHYYVHYRHIKKWEP